MNSNDNYRIMKDEKAPERSIMIIETRKDRSPVRRENAENYLLVSLVAFAVTVVLTRVFLQITGFPQVGNGVLHIAHAIWGGFFLFVAVIFPLVWANRWAIQTSALLSGIGIGLFIDEVGKFITQTNDYFFPPALALIYGFFLLVVFVYLYFRKPKREDPREAMYHILAGLQDALDGDLDTEEAEGIETRLAIARESERGQIVFMAHAIGEYMRLDSSHILAARPGYWKRVVGQADAFGLRLGRRSHRIIISVLLFSWVILVVGFIGLLLLAPPTIEDQIMQWRTVLIGTQLIVGGLMIAALITWLAGEEDLGLKFAVIGLLLSLISLQTLYFYLSQFSAITFALIQLAFMLILLAYRCWYVDAQELRGQCIRTRLKGLR